jgi:hypothetical protein
LFAGNNTSHEREQNQPVALSLVGENGPHHYKQMEEEARFILDAWMES